MIERKATIKTVDNELENLLYKDAKNNNKLKDFYSSYIKLRYRKILLKLNLIKNINWMN